ncbi:MAG: hypothetical protein Q4Q00_06250, partial [Turicibacter sp.]|nr:hypothetical protein [Turicibacter sp.]
MRNRNNNTRNTTNFAPDSIFNFDNDDDNCGCRRRNRRHPDDRERDYRPIITSGDVLATGNVFATGNVYRVGNSTNSTISNQNLTS